MNRRLVCLLLVLAAFSARSETTSRPAPDCKLTVLSDGRPLALESLRGKVLYIDFWASWCGPCAESFPFMNEMHKDLGERGLQVLAVNLDEAATDAKGFLEQHPAAFDIVADHDSQCAQSFGVNAMPSSYLVDRNGMIRYEHLGFRAGEAKEFRALAEQLLAEGSAHDESASTTTGSHSAH